MSTRNFKSNVGTVFALPEPTREDVLEHMRNFAEDNELDESTVTDEEIQTAADFMTVNWQEDIEANIFSDLQTHPKLLTETQSYFDDDRSYGGHIFAGVSLAKTHSEVLYPELELMTRSGYYSGSNFDYNIKITSAYSNEHFDLDDLPVDVIAEEMNGYNNRRPTATQILATRRHLEQEVEKLKKYVEKVLTAYTNPLILVGTFSNGEGVYEPKKLELSHLRG